MEVITVPSSVVPVSDTKMIGIKVSNEASLTVQSQLTQNVKNDDESETEYINTNVLQDCAHFIESKHINEMCNSKESLENPLLIPKPEIEKKPPFITIAETRNSAAEVFIEATMERRADCGRVSPKNILNRRRVKYKCSSCSESFSKHSDLTHHKKNHKADDQIINISDDSSDSSNDDDQQDENFVLSANEQDEDVDESSKNQANTMEVNKSPQDSYTCLVCDDVCCKETEFRNHMNFHLELKRNVNGNGNLFKAVTVTDHDAPTAKTSNSSHMLFKDGSKELRIAAIAAALSGAPGISSSQLGCTSKISIGIPPISRETFSVPHSIEFVDVNSSGSSLIADKISSPKTSITIQSQVQSVHDNLSSSVQVSANVPGEILDVEDHTDAWSIFVGKTGTVNVSRPVQTVSPASSQLKNRLVSIENVKTANPSQPTQTAPSASFQPTYISVIEDSEKANLFQPVRTSSTAAFQMESRLISVEDTIMTNSLRSTQSALNSSFQTTNTLFPIKDNGRASSRLTQTSPAATGLVAVKDTRMTNSLQSTKSTPSTSFQPADTLVLFKDIGKANSSQSAQIMSTGTFQIERKLVSVEVTKTTNSLLSTQAIPSISFQPANTLVQIKNTENSSTSRAVQTSSTANFQPQNTEKTEIGNLMINLKLKSELQHRKIPKIPIGKCTCLGEKKDVMCDFCVNGPKFICENCKHKFRTYELFVEHFTTRHKRLIFICQKCGHGYSKRMYLMQHMSRHNGLQSCYLCTSSFTTKEELVQHMYEHRVKCNECEKICSSQKQLRDHTVEVHKGVTYTCQDCNTTYNKYYLLKAHKDRHHREGEYKCRFCEKIFKKYSTFSRHMQRHRDQRPVQCEECGKEFSSKMYLKAHQQAVHLKKKYTCEVCKKDFATAIGRTNCQNKHADVAKYKCDMCDKAFFYMGSLLVHKRIHTGEKPYICFICSRRFYSSQILFKHCLSHKISEEEIKKKMKNSYKPEKRK